MCPCPPPWVLLGTSWKLPQFVQFLLGFLGFPELDWHCWIFLQGCYTQRELLDREGACCKQQNGGCQSFAGDGDRLGMCSLDGTQAADKHSWAGGTQSSRMGGGSSRDQRREMIPGSARAHSCLLAAGCSSCRQPRQQRQHQLLILICIFRSRTNYSYFKLCFLPARAELRLRFLASYICSRDRG